MRRYFFLLFFPSLVWVAFACKHESNSTPQNTSESTESSPPSQTLSKSKQDIFDQSQEGLPNLSPSPTPTGAEVPTDPVLRAKERAAIAQTLLDIIADSTCTRDASCVALGVNAQACGLPTQYQIFSKEGARYNEVETLVARLVTLDKADAKGSDTIQTCGAPAAPLTQCKLNRCQTR